MKDDDRPLGIAAVGPISRIVYFAEGMLRIAEAIVPDPVMRQEIADSLCSCGRQATQFVAVKYTFRGHGISKSGFFCSPGCVTIAVPSQAFPVTVVDYRWNTGEQMDDDENIPELHHTQPIPVIREDDNGHSDTTKPLPVMVPVVRIDHPESGEN